MKVELIQESDDSVKGKTKALVASNSLPDVYFTWTGSWGENFVRGNRAVDLTPVIGPDTEWGKTLATAAVSASSGRVCDICAASTPSDAAA